MTDYNRIEKAIAYLKEHFREQPSLDEVARQVHLSPFHFQRMFTEWAGVSPKKFLQFLSVEYAKNLLRQRLTLADATFETGLSGTGRLHDLFITIEGMTPGMFRSGGLGLFIHYGFYDTPFGEVIIASTGTGICHLAFTLDREEALNTLRIQFPNATLVKQDDTMHRNALRFFSGDWNNLPQVKLHLKGTPFQLKVWQSLLQVPLGGVTTYANVAGNMRQAKAARAVGSAVGANPVAFLIPCHRVIRSTGITGEYHWGSLRKTAILGWEAARIAS
jgi:AraC family transcriptional regulator of adaptative response/methylated-DNA-[protein]-cysteine methyltransferase